MLSYIYNLCPSHIFITLFVSVMGSFSSVLNLFITRFIINAIQTGNDDKLFCTVLIMILFLLIVNLVYILINNYIQKIVIPRNTQIIYSHMQKELFNKSSIIKMKYYDNPDFFNTFSMALQQSDERAQDVLNTINTFISGLFSIGALFGLVVLLEPFLVIEDSLLYKRLVEDYKNSLADFDKFWFPYYEKYNYMLGENNQFSLDFKTNEIYLVPIEV